MIGCFYVIIYMIIYISSIQLFSISVILISFLFSYCLYMIIYLYDYSYFIYLVHITST